MSVRVIASLRKEGKLKEAYDLAYNELNENPNEWTRMSMFWVLRDLIMKMYIPSNNMEKVHHCLREMGKLLPYMMDTDRVGEKVYQNLLKSTLPNADEVSSALVLSKTNPNDAYKRITEMFGTGAERLDNRLHEDFGWIIYRYMKANTEVLASLEIRGLLRDYIQLGNERPSLLHSMILSYALSFRKGHPDFIFYNFFLLWDPQNLRQEDYHDGYVEDKKIPSLLSRCCNFFVECKDFDVADLVSKFDNKDVIDNLREAYYWKLVNLHNDNRIDDLICEFDLYAENYPKLGPSHWHSKILEIACIFMIDELSTKFIQFYKKWDYSGNLMNEDWIKETNKNGIEFPSLAVRSAKKCFEIVKATPKEKVPKTTLIWLKELYQTIKQRETHDDWSVRNYARLCFWCGEAEEAIDNYKYLLLQMGDKYYLWSELAELLTGRNDLKIGLLLKAKTLEKNEDFLENIHLELASLWEKEGLVTMAAKELEKYVNHRTSKGWGISDRFRELQERVPMHGKESLCIDLNALINKAEEYVYEEYEWTDFVITDKWISENIEHCNLYGEGNVHFTIKTKKFPVLKNAQPGDIVQFRCHIVEKPKVACASRMNPTTRQKTVIPLVARKTEKEAWSILPIKYGVIDYVNEGKKVLHIITQDSKQTFSECKGNPLPTGSYVKFREYEGERRGEVRTCISNVEPCSSEEALQHMSSRIVVVDDVNYTKKLFHVVLGPGKISDTVSFEQTGIRPSIGDFLRISYCIKKNKEGKKRIKFLDIKTSDTGIKGVKCTVTGRLKLKYNNESYGVDNEPDFAFVNDYYVHRDLLRKYHIVCDCEVIAKVVLGGGDKWKVYDLETK